MKYIFSKENIKHIKPINLGKQPKLLRLCNGLRQQEVAEALGINRSTYSYYELDKSRPSYETLLQISYLYDVSVQFLLSQNDI